MTLSVRSQNELVPEVKTKRLLITKRTVSIVAGGLIVLLTIGGAMVTRTPRQDHFQTETVKRAPLRLTVISQGTLKSSKNVKLSSEVEWKTAIVEIVPEGTHVEAGEVICRLDPSTVQTKADHRRGLLTRSDALFQQAREEIELQKMRNERNISAAKMRFELAKLDLKKFKNGEIVQTRNELERQRAAAQEDLQLSEAQREFVERMARKGYSNQSEVEQARLGVVKSQIAQNVASDKKKLFEGYTSHRKLTELDSIVSRLEDELERTKRRAELALLQDEIVLMSRKRTLLVHRGQMTRLERNIESCEIRAPHDGQVVYADAGKRGRTEDPIQVGKEVRYRQGIIELPDLTQMQVETRIHESQVHLLHEGLTTKVRVDAFDDEILHGEVVSIARIPIFGDWPNQEMKVYDTVIRITDELEESSGLKPGMSTKVEIEVEQRDDVLQIPVEAVIPVGKRFRSYVLTEKGLQPRTVIVGRTDDVAIEVIEGLHEGEQVIVNPDDLMREESIDSSATTSLRLVHAPY